MTVLYDENLLTEEQTKIDNAFRSIGEQYYAAHQDETDNPFAEYFAVIKASETRMAEHRAMVMKANGLMICPRCAAQIDIQSVFCNHCGIRVAEQEEEPAVPEAVEEAPVEEPTVPEVAEEAPVEEPTVPEVAEKAPVEEPAAPEVAEEAPAFVAPPVKETNDSFDMPVTKVFDPDWFRKTNKADEKPADVASEESKAVWRKTETQTAAPAVKRICQNCGAAIDDEFAFCIECGTRYVEPSAPAAEPEPVAEPEPEPVAEPAAPVSAPKNIEDDNRTTYADSEVAGNAPAAKAEQRVCQNCGYVIVEADAVFCNNCGTRIEKQPQSSNKKTCKFCGWETTDPEVRFCTECGSKL